MSVDTPATIVIVGAGPVGLEAALYGRFLGYDVEVLERAEIAAVLRGDDAVEHRQPVGRCCSPLGLRALMAQNPTFVPQELETLWTPRELAEQYLIPLSQTDLLSGRISEQTEVVEVRRGEVPTQPAEGTAAGEDALTDDDEYEDEVPRHPPLRVRAVAAEGTERTIDADIVIDASGLRSEGPDYGFVSTLHYLRTTEADRPLPHDPAAALVLPEPNFYILGSKSRQQAGAFQIMDGLRQIRDLFGLIGGRGSLDLYQDLGRFH